MRIGVVFPQIEFTGDPIAIRDYAQAVEGMGYRHFLAYDHVLGADTTNRPDWSGAYKATDAYANFSIYSGRKAFPMPGPKVWSSGSAGGASAGTPAKEEAAPPAAATTLATAVAPAPAAPTAAAPAPATGGAVAKYAQCGGKGFTGATGCASGSTCKAANEWYSQCL